MTYAGVGVGGGVAWVGYGDGWMGGVMLTFVLTCTLSAQQPVEWNERGILHSAHI